MYKNIHSKLQEFNRLQREGVDQTDNYILLFGDNTRVVEMAKINAMKIKVQKGKFYVSRKKSKTTDEYLVIDMVNGQVYKIKSKLYTVKVVDDNILVIDNNTGEEHFLIEGGKLDFRNVKHLGMNNYTYFSGDSSSDYKGVPAVRFENNFADSIRVHWIIALMKCGIIILNLCVGNSPTHKLRHIVAYEKSKNNSVRNLQILKGTDDKNTK
ncbi:hypothetical protein [Metabacillus sp. B2-18]|uniref:hypothetical protein n=1 Tax=Metabacillus sp. B2-18 TaxID=2897333 RepID=UPI001E4C6616|nr:hypothetical protein [Metabacillus sp. B2-18]UGB29969.1 hypothetical protein LPC09_19955 [Metabacillus sp. B2-18]